ncbi:MAG: aminotransferase class V-fold PLP-dependent enzyme [Ruminococcaceae bacterium]|nr:aminotransferase class V-fold PLP-dependent enzyme [Oscillospiraceae bacterium]
MIYLDNAATTGVKPLGVKKAVANAINNLSANPGRSGHMVAQRAGEAIYKTRQQVADLFSSGSQSVVFTPNCTQAINYVIKGVLQEGDHVIISSMEHNAVARPIHRLKTDGVIDYDIAQVIMGDSEATIRSFERLIRPNTKLIISLHGSNVTGELMPIKELAKCCRDRGILFAVDAAQTAGVIPINMREIGIDFLFIAPHKGLYAPMGTGILIAEKPIEKTIIEGGTGSYSNLLSQPDELPDRLESGTVNLPGIMGISAGIDFLNNVGIDKIYSHEKQFCRVLCDELKSISGVSVFSALAEAELGAPVVSFNIDGLTSMETAELLSKKGIAVRAGLHCAPLAHLTIGTADIGTVRVSPSYFNKHSDIFLLKRAIFDIKKAKNIAKRY